MVSTFLPVNSILLSSENKKNRVKEAVGVDKRTMLSDSKELSEEKINELVDTFMNTLPSLLKSQLQAA